MDDDDGVPGRAELAEQLEDGGLRAGVDPGEGLVHREHGGLLGERPGDEHALALAP